MNSKDWEKRKSEFIKYNHTIFDEAAAIKSGYAILGGDNHLEIEEAIARVYDKLEKRYDEFIHSDEFLNCKEEQEAFKQEPLVSQVLYATQFLIDLLREDGYLREKLGKDKETKLYEEFYVRDDTSKDLRYYNQFSTLSNCLKRVIEKRKNKDKYKNVALLQKETKLIGNVPIKRRVIERFKEEEKYKDVWQMSENTKPTTSIAIKNPVALSWIGKTQKDLSFENEMISEFIKDCAKKTSDNLILEIKIINFGQTAIKGMSSSNESELVKFKVGSSVIYDTFLERDKTNRYPSYAKKQIIKKLWNYQKTQILSVETRGGDTGIALKNYILFLKL